MSFDYQRFHSTQREVGEVQAIPIPIRPVERDRERNDRERNDISPRTIVSSLSEVPSIETDEDGNGQGGGATTNSLTESLFSILAFSDYEEGNRVCSWRYLKCLFFSCFVTWLVLSLFYSLTYSFRDSLHNTSGVFEATKPFLRSFVHSI